MKKIFSEYGGVVVTVVAVVALIAFVTFMMSSNGSMAQAFSGLTMKFANSSHSLIDAAAGWYTSDDDDGGGAGSGEEEGGFPISGNTMEVSANNTKAMVTDLPVVKISDYTPTGEVLSKTELVVSIDGTPMNFACVSTLDYGGACLGVYSEEDMLFVISVTTTEPIAMMDGGSFPETGLWMMDYGALGMDVDFVIDVRDMSVVVPGLYVSGSGYTQLKMSWGQLLADGVIYVDNGVLYTNADAYLRANDSAEALAGDLMLPQDGSITALGDCVLDMISGSHTGRAAFTHCNQLTGICIPASVTSISDAAFNGCTSLASCNLPDGITEISVGMFASCAALTQVDIPTSVCRIGYSAFNGCVSLTSVSVPDNVTDIDVYAFHYCENLRNVYFGENSKLAAIGMYAFSTCSNLLSIHIPASVTSIDRGAFDYCTNLSSISFGSFANICFDDGDGISECFSDCGITDVHLGNANADIAAWCENGGKLSGAYNLYVGDTLLTELVIPNSVTSIGEYAFSDCTSLTSITIPDSVTSIGWYAFRNCTSLTHVTFGDNGQLKTLGNEAFLGCTNLTEVDFGQNGQLSSLGNAFNDCTGLTSFTIPNSVSEISDWVFFGCWSLENIIFDGTIAEWQAIEKVDSWSFDAPAFEVVCSDGTVAL